MVTDKGRHDKNNMHLAGPLHVHMSTRWHHMITCVYIHTYIRRPATCHIHIHIYCIHMVVHDKSAIKWMEWQALFCGQLTGLPCAASCRIVLPPQGSLTTTCLSFHLNITLRQFLVLESGWNYSGFTNKWQMWLCEVMWTYVDPCSFKLVQVYCGTMTCTHTLSEYTPSSISSLTHLRSCVSHKPV